MKTSIVLPILLMLLLSTTSCETLNGVFGKSSNKENKAKSKIEDIQRAQVENEKSKMEEISALASGTDYALNKLTNKEPPVIVAQDINKRISSLAGKPNLNAEKEMWNIIDELTSENAKLRLKGERDLAEKDKRYAELQNETKSLLNEKDVEIVNYMKQAQATARLADTRKAALDEYQGWFGLKAVFLGMKQFLLTSVWVLLGLCIVFLVLRGFASSNPAVGAIFGIFEQMVAWVINTIAVLFPKALTFAGTVSKKVYDESTILLKKLVDNLQNLKNLQAKLGHDLTLKELFVELDKSLDENEKAMVDKIKKELGY